MPEVQCMASQINQVVLNMLVNAAHAIGPERGSITVRTGHTDDTVAMMAQRGTALVPTLINIENFGDFAAAADRYPTYAAHMRDLYAQSRSRIAAAREAGVPVYAGTDAGGLMPHGQIAAEVEISTTTFFRYFPSKADVILCHQDANMPQLRAAIIAYPPGESDLTAVEHAIKQVWVPNADPLHSQRAGQAVAASVSLRGLYNEMSRNWLEGIAAALAARRGLREPDDGAIITARVALGVFNEAVRAWGSKGYKAGVGAEVDRAFATLRQLSAGWTK